PLLRRPRGPGEPPLHGPGQPRATPAGVARPRRRRPAGPGHLPRPGPRLPRLDPRRAGGARQRPGPVLGPAADPRPGGARSAAVPPLPAARGRRLPRRRRARPALRRHDLRPECPGICPPSALLPVEPRRTGRGPLNERGRKGVRPGLGGFPAARPIQRPPRPRKAVKRTDCPMLLLLILAQAVGPADALGPGDHTPSLTVGDRKRAYLVHVPKSYDGSKPYP